MLHQPWARGRRWGGTAHLRWLCVSRCPHFIPPCLPRLLSTSPGNLSALELGRASRYQRSGERDAPTPRTLHQSGLDAENIREQRLKWEKVWSNDIFGGKRVRMRVHVCFIAHPRLPVWMSEEDRHFCSSFHPPFAELYRLFPYSPWFLKNSTLKSLLPLFLLSFLCPQGVERVQVRLPPSLHPPTDCLAAAKCTDNLLWLCLFT